MSNCKRRFISGALVFLLLLAGLSAPAWLRGAEVSASETSTPAPDLVIASLTFSPETPCIGDTVIFTVKIKNQGNSQAEASSIAYSIDEQTLATSAVDSIDSGAVTVKTFTWKAKAGPHVFRAIIDSDNGIDESAEDNNDKTCAFSVLAPDLAIDSISWTPLNPSMGDKVTFTVTIINQGDKRAGAFHVDFYIEGNTRGDHSITGIEPGASVPETYTWIASPGFHNIRATADVLHQVTESDEANNDSEATCASSQPDFIISSITMSPGNPVAGDSVTFTISVKNQGSGKAGPSGVTFYLDDSAQEWVFLESLNAGATTTTNFIWIYETMSRTFKATIDVEDMVKESDETNNSKTLALPQYSPDLIIQDITWSPSSPLINQPMSIYVTVKNQGKGIAGASELTLSVDSTYIFHAFIPELAADATITAIFNWAPKAFSHTMKALIDVTGLVKESNESNNTLTKTMTSTNRIPTADLTIDKITCSPAKPAIGETLTISLVVKNQGAGIASPSTTTVYIDNNPVNSVYTNELDAGKTLTLDITVPLKGLPFKSTYKVSAVLDGNDTVFETNESNNQKETSFSITAPDLVVQAINWSPEVPVAGDKITFNVTIKNPGDLKSGGAYISYYVDKAFMGKHSIEDLEPGTAVTRSFTWAVQKQPFTFTAVIDEDNQVTESNESNNSKTVALPAPDLIIDSIVWSPENPTENISVTFTAIIRNRGFSRAANTLLSCYFDAAAPLSFDTAEINPGSTATVVFTHSFLSGEHSIRLIADGSDTISESNESNNEKTIKVSVQSPASGVKPTATTEPAKKTEAKQPVPVSTTPAKTGDNLSQLNKTPAPAKVKDIAGNITAPPPKWQAILLNRWLIIGVGAMGIGSIVVLMLLRKRAHKA